VSIDKMWVIYDGPKDYPDKIVVREHILVPAEPVEVIPGVMLPGEYLPDVLCSLFDYIFEAREHVIREGATCRMPVFANDDPVIAEVWA
jgi:hypothetical protein